jgi:pyruvate dehydrogenase E2 component (dihydrolipoamide acetyltransferase)
MAQEIKLTLDGTLLNWLKDKGAAVKTGDIIAEFEADKATVEVQAPADGVLVELRAEVGTEYREGAVIAVLGAAGETAAVPAKTESVPVASAAPAAKTGNGAVAAAATTPEGRIKASPVAKKIAEDRGIDLAQIAGTGPGGRIIKEDVEQFTPGAAPAKPAPLPDAPTVEVPAATQMQSYGKLPEGSDVEILDVSRMRRAIAKGTVTSVQTTPHFYVTVEVDVAALLHLRKQLNDGLTDQGIKISVNDMLVKGVALALRQFPNLNTHYYGDKMVRHKRINIAIAVSLPNNGLINVVSPDADKTTLSALARYHAEMFEEVRNGKIKPEYIQGGTFLVSNLGAYQVESFSSIIDPPQAAALAVGAARQIPVVQSDGTLGVGSRMKMTLSIDHRVSDGAEGAQYLQYLRGLIENPMRLLI